MARRSGIDWEGIERAFRLGRTFAEMTSEFGVNASSITRRAQKEGWTRDLSEQVRAATRARVSAAVAEKAQDVLSERTMHNAQAVEAEAISNALMIAEHERVGTQSRALFAKILGQIEQQIDSTPTIEQLAELIGRESPEAIPALRRVLSLPSYVDAAKKATEGAAKAIELERRARNIDSPGVNGSIESALASQIPGVNMHDMQTLLHLLGAKNK